MEIFGAVASAVQLVDVAVRVARTFQPNEQGRSSWTPILPPATNECYLRVFDLSYTGDASQRLAGESNNRATLKDDLEALPPQETTFRVYLFERFSVDNTTLFTHLYSRGFPTSAKASERAENTFEALASQWRASNAMSYESTMYSFENVGNIYNSKHGYVDRGLAFLAGLIRINMSIQIRDVTGADDKFISMAIPLDSLAYCLPAS
jgi:hypothetical protein